MYVQCIIDSVHAQEDFTCNDGSALLRKIRSDKNACILLVHVSPDI